MSKRQKAVIWLFGLTFVIMILGLIPWTNLNSHWTFFDSFTKWLTGIPFLGNLLGHDMAPLGTWYFNEITMLFLFMSVLIMWVYHMKESEFMDAFMKGMADFLSVAIIVAVARGIQVVMNNGMITGTVLHWGETGLDPINFRSCCCNYGNYWSSWPLCSRFWKSSYYGLSGCFRLGQLNYPNFWNCYGCLSNRPR